MPTSEQETRRHGLPLSSGIGVACVCRFEEPGRRELPDYRVADTGVEREQERLQHALRQVCERLDELRDEVETRIGLAESGIFAAQKTIADDPAALAEMRRRIEQDGSNAEQAVATVFGEYEKQLSQVDDEYLGDRASDIGEIRCRLLDALGHATSPLQCRDGQHCQRGRDRVVVTKELTPGLTLTLDTERTVGFITERGGINSHAAILARALGIPAVSGLEGIHTTLRCGEEVLVNGTTGEIVVSPTQETIREARARYGEAVPQLEPVPPVDGFRVMASISRADDLCAALSMQAEGVGLYRTEFEFMAAGRKLSEDEQAALYRQVCDVYPDQPVYFRLLDLGGDKPLPFLHGPHERNPALGCRGTRFLLENRELLTTQVRALARTSASHPVHIMLPMITGVDQFLHVRQVIAEATADLVPQNLRIGVMFEVPAACLQAGKLLDLADFGSIGSNDLIQYLLAVDRDNELVAADYDAENPVLWELMADIARAARDRGKPLTLCGELAGNPKHVTRLREAGIQSVSVSPRLIRGVRQVYSNSEWHQGGAGI